MSCFLAQRVIEPEMMDQPGLDAQQHEHALRGLSRLNRLSGSAKIVTRALNQIETTATCAHPLRILDIATGGGDLPIALTQHAQQTKRSWQISGCDISDTAVTYAREQAAQEGLETLDFFQCDVIVEPLPSGYDVVVLALFLHHLEREVCIDLLQKARAASRFLIVSDLSRSWLSYVSVWLGSRIVTRSKVVHTDALLSVRAAFKREELLSMAAEAGWRELAIRSVPPARWLMTGRSA